ncbi:hypothetical protein [Sphaerisporangium album]|nr:hypothetical protein [Sphaerisporangium album]
MAGSVRRTTMPMLGRYSFALPDLPGGIRPLDEPGDTYPGEGIGN